MVYKRYIKQNGKLFGPYYYSSHRKGKKIISKYLPEFEEDKKLNLFNIFSIGFIFLILMFMFLITGINYTQYNNDLRIMGKVINEISNSNNSCTNCNLGINFNSAIVKGILLAFFFMIMLFLGSSLQKRKEKKRINKISHMSYAYSKEESQKMIQKLLKK